jgi:hypothetical protein
MSRLTRAGQIAIAAGNDRQVKVIAHQAVGQQIDIGVPLAVDEQLHERGKIRRLAKDLLPIVSTIEHVIHAARDRRPRRSWHER